MLSILTNTLQNHLQTKGKFTKIYGQWVSFYCRIRQDIPLCFFSQPSKQLYETIEYITVQSER